MNKPSCPTYVSPLEPVKDDSPTLRFKVIIDSQGQPTYYPCSPDHLRNPRLILVVAVLACLLFFGIINFPSCR